MDTDKKPKKQDSNKETNPKQPKKDNSAGHKTGLTGKLQGGRESLK